MPYHITIDQVPESSSEGDEGSISNEFGDDWGDSWADPAAIYPEESASQGGDKYSVSFGSRDGSTGQVEGGPVSRGSSQGSSQVSSDAGDPEPVRRRHLAARNRPRLRPSDPDDDNESSRYRQYVKAPPPGYAYPNYPAYGQIPYPLAYPSQYPIPNPSYQNFPSSWPANYRHAPQAGALQVPTAPVSYLPLQPQGPRVQTNGNSPKGSPSINSSEDSLHGGQVDQQRLPGENRSQAQAIPRHGTGDLTQPHGSGKRIRFKVMLRSRSMPLIDEEKGLGHLNYSGPFAAGYNVNTPLPQDMHEIVQTRWTWTDDGQEDVMLTLKDNAQQEDQMDPSNHMRWLHLMHEAPTFRQFINQVIEIPGLKSTELALAVRLLNRVRREEKYYIHGRYFEPMTIVYEGEDPDRRSEHMRSTVTFVCFPYFDLNSLLKTSASSDSHAHQIRSLLQTQSRLESTLTRDAAQVLGKAKNPEDQSRIHLPHIWALIINKDLLVTCGPCQASVLRGKSVRTNLHSKAKLDDEAWAIQYKNLSGHQFFIPNLIEQVCRPDLMPAPWSADLVREQLLNSGQIYKLVDLSSGEIAYEESWPQMLRQQTSRSISLELQEKIIFQVPLVPSAGSMDESVQDRESLMSLSAIPTAQGENVPSALEFKPSIFFHAHQPRESTSTLSHSVPEDPRILNSHSTNSEKSGSKSGSVATDPTDGPSKDLVNDHEAQSADVATMEAASEDYVKRKSTQKKVFNTLEAKSPNDQRDKVAKASKIVSFKVKSNKTLSRQPPNNNTKSKHQKKPSPCDEPGEAQHLALQVRDPQVKYDIPQYAISPLQSPYYNPGYKLWDRRHMHVLPKTSFIPSQRTGFALPNIDDLSYVPQKRSGVEENSFERREKSEMNDKLITHGHGGTVASSFDVRALMISRSRSLTDPELCHEWRSLCNRALASRRTLKTFPEPPSWPCHLHDSLRRLRSLKACTCNLQKIYSIFGYHTSSLKKERRKWHPDRFATCSQGMQDKAEELFEELGAMILGAQRKSATYLRGEIEAMALPVVFGDSPQSTVTDHAHHRLSASDDLTAHDDRNSMTKPVVTIAGEMLPSLQSDHKSQNSSLTSTSFFTINEESNLDLDKQKMADKIDVFQYLDDDQESDPQQKPNVFSYLDESWETKSESKIRTSNISNSIIDISNIHKLTASIRHLSKTRNEESPLSRDRRDRRSLADTFRRHLLRKGMPEQKKPSDNSPRSSDRTAENGIIHENVTRSETNLKATVEDASDEEKPVRRRTIRRRSTSVSQQTSEIGRSRVSSRQKDAKECFSVAKGMKTSSETPAHEAILTKLTLKPSKSASSAHDPFSGHDYLTSSTDMNEPQAAIFLWPTGPVKSEADLSQNAISPPENRGTESTRIEPVSKSSNVSGRGNESFEQVPGKRRTNDRTLKLVLDECHDRLLASNKFGDGLDYHTLNEKDEIAVGACAKQLKAKADEIESLGKLIQLDESEEDELGLLRQKQRLFVLATSLLRSFVPPGYDADVVSKYWGAVYVLLLAAEEEADLSDLENRLWSFHKLINSMLLGVRSSDEQYKVYYQMPRALPTAFRSLVMSFVGARARLLSKGFSKHKAHCQIFESILAECGQYLLEGRNQLILMVHTDDYRERVGYEALDPTALLSTMIRNLLGLSHTRGRLHITELYSEYMAELQSLVRNSASVKMYTDIERLAEELDAIKAILDKQSATLWDFRRGLQCYEGTSEFVGIVLERMLNQIQRQAEEFKELQAQAEQTRHRAAQSISLKAESNNKVLLVFTAVTTIFLPLSFVTSYFGMNTVDVRDMKSTQGLFWATGLPLTLVVLGAAWIVAHQEGMALPKFMRMGVGGGNGREGKIHSMKRYGS